MNTNFKKDEIKKYVIIGTILILIYWTINNISTISGYFGYITNLIMPFIIGGVIAFIFNVPMRQIEKHLFTKEKYQTKNMFKIRRLCSYIITLFLIIFIIAMAMLVIIPQIVETIKDIISVVPGAVQNFADWLTSTFNAFPELEESINKINWNSALNSLISFVTDSSKGIISGGIGAVSGFISGITSFFIGFVFSVYLLFQKEKLGRQLRKVLYACLPKNKVEKIFEIQKISDNTFANFLSGQCLEAVILGTLFVIAMTIFRMPYALLIGVAIAITALIPIIGAFIGCIVGVILIGINSPIQAVAFIVLFLVLQQLEGNLIYPHVVGSSIGLPGIWVLVAVSVGGNLFGIAGILIFIPLSSVLYALFKVYINNRLKKREIDIDFL